MVTYDFECISCRKSVELNLPVEKASGKGIKCPYCGKKKLKRIYNFYFNNSKGSGDGKTSACPTGTCPFVN